MGCPTGLSSVKQRRYRHLCVCVCVSPPFSSSICCYALSFLFIYLPSFLYIRLTHSLVWANTHKQVRIHKVISCESCLAMALTSLAFIGQLHQSALICLEEHRVSYLFGCTLPTALYPSLFFPTVHPRLSPPICFPNISTHQPPPEYTHTRSLQMV